MAREEFFDEMALRRAAARTNESLLSVLPGPGACERSFSERFLAKMEKLLKRQSNWRIRHAVLRYAAAILITVSLTLGTLLVFSPEARASLTQWVREKYENGIIYRFHNEPSHKLLPLYELTWIPEGMEQKQIHYNEFSYGTFYYNDETEQGFSLDYSYMDNSSLPTVIPEEGCTVTHTEVNGCPADFYQMLDNRNTNVLVILDEDANIIFSIAANIDKDSIFNIAEHIVLSKTPKN